MSPTKRKPEEPSKARDHQRSGRATTMRDVSEYVGVSQATVSAILSDAANASAFSESTRSAVKAAAKILGYNTNPLARALRRTRSGVIGCVLCNQHDLYYARAVETAESYAHDNGYALAVASMGYDFKRFEDCMSLMAAWRVEGLLLFLGGRSIPQEVSDKLSALQVPIQIGDGDFDSASSFITMFNVQSGRIAAEHLLTLGHRYICVVGHNVNNLHAKDRLKGMKDCLGEAGQDLTDDDCYAVPKHLHGPHAGYACALAALDSGREYTAMVCLNDLVAMGTLVALRERGIDVPRCTSVISFDDLALDADASEQNRLGNFLLPPLTTVRLPMRELCKEAVCQLLSRIGPSGMEMPKGGEHMPRLMIRSSTAKPSRLPR